MVTRSPWRASRSRPRRRRAPWVRRATVRRLARSGRRLARSVRRSIVALRAAPPPVRIVAGVVVLLVALAQVEGSGNPVARTYWRWSLARNPFKVYQPASSAVGMYQITDATFSEARRYCIHDHVVVEEGPWLDPSSCWFNILYCRVVPSHAIEMTSALLDRRVASAVERHRVAAATPGRQQDLAAVIHLCGAAAGDAYAARGFRLAASQRCGDHDVGAYLAQVNAMKRRFARLAAAD